VEPPGGAGEFRRKRLSAQEEMKGAEPHELSTFYLIPPYCTFCSERSPIVGIETTTSFADIKEGTQVTVQVVDATYDPEGRFGPAVELELEVEEPKEHAGTIILSTFGLSQPRLNKVRDLRNDGFDDEAIAEVLRKKNFEFDKIDEPETPRLGGALLRITKACYNEDPRAIRKLLAECDSFHDLADALVGKRFVASTRKDKNDYTRIDGKAEFYLVMEPKPGGVGGPYAGTTPENEADFDDIPF
jgi:hypothetical protein